MVEMRMKSDRDGCNDDGRHCDERQTVVAIMMMMSVITETGMGNTK